LLNHSLKKNKVPVLGRTSTKFKHSPPACSAASFQHPSSPRNQQTSAWFTKHGKNEKQTLSINISILLENHKGEKIDTGSII
jgi:hypothetical protein